MAAASEWPKKNTEVHLKDRYMTCVNCTTLVSASHHKVFDRLADPNIHAAMFKSVEGASAQLIEDSGTRKIWHVDSQARWKFWKLGGSCESKVVFHTDRDSGTATFKLREPGFLKMYEGTWSIRPDPQSEVVAGDSHRTRVTIDVKMVPKLQPPYPLNLALKGMAASQVEELVDGLANACQIDH
jgi:Polyketide cyclase / dehydrase and lipid transport